MGRIRSLLLLCALGAGCDRAEDRPAPRPAAGAAKAAKAGEERGAQAAEPDKAERSDAGARDGAAAAEDNGDPSNGKFSLEEATEGLAGKGGLVATIDLGKAGKLTCDLYDEAAPNAVANFVGLARGTRPFRDPETRAWIKRPFYDGLLCHRVIPGFVVHCGDPIGKGTGDPGYLFPVELTPDLAFDRPGRLAMANKSGQDLRNGSQFFITETAAPWLNGRYAIFGQCQPAQVIEKLTRVPVDSPMNNRPVEDVVMKKVTISRGGRAAKR